MRPPRLRRALPALAGLAVPTFLGAQLPRASARALGMLQSQTAAARGYETIAWNPALLAMPGRPSFSINVAQFSAQEWSNTLDAGDVFSYLGDTLTTADKDAILAKIPTGHPFTLGAGIDGGAIGLTFRNFGLFLGGQGDFEGRLSRDFTELLLYGNVRRRAAGSAPFTADSSGGAGWAGGTLAAAMGLPIPIPMGFLAVGVTVKLTQGFTIGGVEDLGSQLQTTPFAAVGRAHLLYASPDSSLANGLGVGADLGVAYELASGLRLGLAIENVFSSMSWDEDELLYEWRDYRLLQQGDTYVETLDSIPRSPFDPSDPLQAALRDSILGRSTFPTRVRAGAQLRVGPVLLAGDAMIRVKRGLVPGEAQRFSAAAELPLSVAAFRGGFATDFDTGITFGGGIGFKLGPARLDAAANWTPGGDRQGIAVALGVGIMN